MANTTIVVDSPAGSSVPWYINPTIAKVTATFNSTTYNTANNVGIIVDFANLVNTGVTGTANVYGALTMITDPPWGLNTGDGLDVISVLGTSTNTFGLQLIGVKTVSGQPTQRSLMLAAGNNSANLAAMVEITSATLTGTMDIFVLFAKGIHSWASPGTGA